MANIDELIEDWKSTNSSQTFDKIWELTVGMVNPHKYFDPTRARTLEDFNQITREALFSAIKTYQPGAGSTVLSWIKMKMSQFLIKELKKIKREGRLHKDSLRLDQTFNDHEAPITYLNLSQFDGKEIDEEVINRVIQEVRSRLSSNILILQVFDIKLVFPNISRHSIHVMTGISKPTLSKYFSIMRAQCLDVFKKFNY